MLVAGSQLCNFIVVVTLSFVARLHHSFVARLQITVVVNILIDCSNSCRPVLWVMVA